MKIIAKIYNSYEVCRDELLRILPDVTVIDNNDSLVLPAFLETKDTEQLKRLSKKYVDTYKEFIPDIGAVIGVDPDTFQPDKKFVFLLHRILFLLAEWRDYDTVKKAAKNCLSHIIGAIDEVNQDDVIQLFAKPMYYRELTLKTMHEAALKKFGGRAYPIIEVIDKVFPVIDSEEDDVIKKVSKEMVIDLLNECSRALFKVDTYMEAVAKGRVEDVVFDALRVMKVKIKSGEGIEEFKAKYPSPMMFLDEAMKGKANELSNQTGVPVTTIESWGKQKIVEIIVKLMKANIGTGEGDFGERL